MFACNWDGWSCIETATNLGLHYPASVKVVKVSCLTRVHVGLILKAFEFGADGVMLLGCEEGRCRFGADSGHTVEEYQRARSILELLGISKGRLALVQLAAFDGHQFVNQAMKLIRDIQQIRAMKRPRIVGPRLIQNIKV